MNKLAARLLATIAMWGIMTSLTGCGGSSSDTIAPTDAETSSVPAGATVDLSDKNYFPLSQGDHWIYDSRQSGSDQLGIVSRTVLSGPDAAGNTVVREVADNYLDDTEFVISTDSITQTDPVGARDQYPGIYHALPDALAYTKGLNTVGLPHTRSASGNTGVDIDADGKEESFQITIKRVFKGLKQVAVMGVSTETAHFTAITEIRINYTNTLSSVFVTFTEDEYFAQDIGLVKAVRSVIRGDGTVLVPTTTLTLRSARVSGVTHGGASSALDRSLIEITESNRVNSAPRTESVFVTTTAESGRGGLYVSTSQTNFGITSVIPVVISSNQTRLDIQFATANYLAPGTYTDTITVKICYDPACIFPIGPTPATIATRYTVTNTPPEEIGVPDLPVTSQQVLSHNVIDSEYSQALEAIVMVSSWPDNALYVYDTTSASEKKFPLHRAPTAVSIAPDGLSAAVGHDGMVTWVNLNSLISGSAPSSKTLNISTVAFDIALDQWQRVHVIPSTSQWSSLHSVDVATNTESTVGWLLNGGSHGRLHPSGRALYTADNGLSPSDIARWNLTSTGASYVGDSPYHGDYGMCGDLWFSEDGLNIFTACGNVFTASDDRSQDMRYTGSMSLSSGPYGYRILSLSQSAETKEIALIENNWYNCSVGSNDPCYDHVRTYDSDHFNAIATYRFPWITVTGTPYAQRGVNVFHSKNGTKLYVLSRLANAPDPASEYYLTIVR